MDELLRAAWGLIWAYPVMRLVQRWGLYPLPATIVVTAWMVAAWRVYRLVEGWL